MDSSLIIRPETPADYFAAEAMVRRAFFNRQNPGCNEHYLVHILRSSPDFLPSYTQVAEIEGRIVGAIYFSKACIRTAKGDIPIVTFGPLAVDPVHQGRGIGRALFEKSVALLRQSVYPAIAIYGEPSYYPRLGFQRAARYGITDPEGNVYDPLMVFELKENGLKGIQGKLFESSVFEKASDEEALLTFDARFPAYRKLKVPSQWLHETNLGQIAKIEGNHYRISYWDIFIEAELSLTYASPLPQVGNYVTFRRNKKGLSWIETLEIPQ